jgi:hypothetical protein
MKTKRTVLLLAILCVSIASAQAWAKDHPWKNAKVIDITTEKNGPAVVPVAALVGAPATRTYYWIQTDTMIYVLGRALSAHQLLNVTLHGPTQIAIDGNTAHILDDDGKDRKMPIVETIERPKQEK